MKNKLNLILGIQGQHFYTCPHVKGFDNVDEDPNCHCQDKCYKITLYIGFTMFALEFLGGILSNSLSLIGDSFHLLADSAAVIIGLVVLKLISQNEKKEGIYRKRAVIVNGSLLLLASFYLLFESFFKFMNPSYTAGVSMTVVATIGIVGNFLQHHMLISVTGDSVKEDLVRTSIILHIFSDLLQSFAVVAGGICLIFITDPKIGCLIDPFLSTGIGFLMGFASIKLIFKAYQNVPKDDHRDHSHCGHHHRHH